MLLRGLSNSGIVFSPYQSDQVIALINTTLLPAKKLLRVALHQPYRCAFVGWHFNKSIYVSVVSNYFRVSDLLAPWAGAFKPRLVAKVREHTGGTEVHYRIRVLSPFLLIALIGYLLVTSTLIVLIRLGMGINVLPLMFLIYVPFVLSVIIAQRQSYFYVEQLKTWIVNVAALIDSETLPTST